jgi:hypothetical protein
VSARDGGSTIEARLGRLRAPEHVAAHVEPIELFYDVVYASDVLISFATTEPYTSRAVGRARRSRDQVVAVAGRSIKRPSGRRSAD